MAGFDDLSQKRPPILAISIFMGILKTEHEKSLRIKC